MMNEYNQILLKSIIKVLEGKIEVIRKAKSNDYNEGVIDGLIIAIRTIEG